jgi:hypothetical protein
MRAMTRVWYWIAAFCRFWYRFIIGDDWTIAACVAGGIVATAVLNVNHLTAWWLIPLVVVAILGISLRRASRVLR